MPRSPWRTGACCSSPGLTARPVTTRLCPGKRCLGPGVPWSSHIITVLSRDALKTLLESRAQVTCQGQDRRGRFISPPRGEHNTPLSCQSPRCVEMRLGRAGPSNWMCSCCPAVLLCRTPTRGTGGTSQPERNCCSPCCGRGDLSSETFDFMGETAFKTQMSPVRSCFEHWDGGSLFILPIHTAQGALGTVPAGGAPATPCTQQQPPHVCSPNGVFGFVIRMPEGKLKPCCSQTWLICRIMTSLVE